MTTKLQKIRQKAKAIGIKSEVNISKAKGKKFSVKTPAGKTVNFGAKGMEDFLDHKDNKRKTNFHNRFKGNKGYNNPESGLYYSRKLLW